MSWRLLRLSECEGLTGEVFGTGKPEIYIKNNFFAGQASYLPTMFDVTLKFLYITPVLPEGIR
jgi:hypothetical protein